MQIIKRTATFLFCALSTACVVPINEHTADNSVAVAAVAQQRGKWDNARVAYAKAVTEPSLNDADPKKQAIMHYEYGRALGVTCFFDMAEAELNRAYELDKQSFGPVYLTLVELARLNLDQKKYAQSVDYFERAMPELEFVNAVTEDPRAFADILDEYASALGAVGRAAEAQTATQRASDIRTKNPGTQPITDRTPYGKQCTKS